MRVGGFWKGTGQSEREHVVWETIRSPQDEELFDEPDILEDILDGIGAAQLGEAPDKADGASSDAEGEEGDEAGDEVEPVSPSQAADAAHIMDRGFVACTLPPWSEVGFLGRLTDWPPNRPAATRNVSMRCCMHGGKCNFISTRSRVQDRDLLVWLFHARPVHATATRAEIDEAGRQHKALGFRFLRTGSFADEVKASGSGAASSSGAGGSRT